MSWANGLAPQSTIYYPIPSNAALIEITGTTDCVPITTSVFINGQGIGEFSLPTNSDQPRFPVTVKPKQNFSVTFDVTFGCAVDPAKSSKKDPGHEDYRFTARVDHVALGSGDSHPDDDTCQRGVSPPGVIDPFPNGKIQDKGCGTKKADGTFGDPVLVDVIVKP